MSTGPLIELLRNGRHSLVVDNGGILIFDGRGISDLHTLVTDGRHLLRGASVADKIVGKGAAALMALGGVAEVYGEVISTSAKTMLNDRNIAVSFTTEVAEIINRNGDDICPIERLCHDCDTPEECLPLITHFLTTQTLTSK